MNHRRLTLSLKMGIVKIVMWLSENFTQTNVGVIKAIVRLAYNDYLKEFESILQNGRVAARSGFY